MDTEEIKLDGDERDFHMVMKGRGNKRIKEIMDREDIPLQDRLRKTHAIANLIIACKEFEKMNKQYLTDAQYLSLIEKHKECDKFVRRLVKVLKSKLPHYSRL